MLISSLEQMEDIVKKSKSLKWDGWDVIHFYPSDKGRTSSAGMRIGSKWFLHKRFPVGEKGWELPNKFMR
jgi:hypothetical protein